MLEKILRLFKRRKCNHTFKRYECISDIFTFLGWNYSDCTHCGKPWSKLNKDQKEKAEYIDSGVSL
jgi:hypothetical protein